MEIFLFILTIRNHFLTPLNPDFYYCFRIWILVSFLFLNLILLIPPTTSSIRLQVDQFFFFFVVKSMNLNLNCTMFAIMKHPFIKLFTFRFFWYHFRHFFNEYDFYLTFLNLKLVLLTFSDHRMFVYGWFFSLSTGVF